MQIDIHLDWATRAQEQAVRQATSLAARLGGAFLHATDAGRYAPVPADWWTSGFWPGALLLIYQRTHEPGLLELARVAEDELDRAITSDLLYGLHHDVGFQFMPTAVARYKLTHDADARRRGVLAAALLMSRFNPAGNFIEAWNGERARGMAIIDTMMNLPLLFWAAEETGELRYRNVAEAHAQTAITHFVRPDGSTHHIVRFNQKTGEPTERLGGQGYAPDSCWSRGQAWGLYGFTLAYRYTQNPVYLTTAQKLADSFLGALPPSLVPPWDFRAPDADTAPRDSSAAAIAASGLLELAHALPDQTGAAYQEAALCLLQALVEQCAAWDRPGEDGILLHATGALPNNRDIDVSLIYGDFFFLEALGKIHGATETCW
jgi:unsaturated chondroitin disaccharide hydrolase